MINTNNTTQMSPMEFYHKMQGVDPGEDIQCGCKPKESFTETLVSSDGDCEKFQKAVDVVMKVSERMQKYYDGDNDKVSDTLKDMNPEFGQVEVKGFGDKNMQSFVTGSLKCEKELGLPEKFQEFVTTNEGPYEETAMGFLLSEETVHYVTTGTNGLTTDMTMVRVNPDESLSLFEGSFKYELCKEHKDFLDQDCQL
jgi:hypothetical protein